MTITAPAMDTGHRLRRRAEGQPRRLHPLEDRQEGLLLAPIVLIDQTDPVTQAVRIGQKGRNVPVALHPIAIDSAAKTAGIEEERDAHNMLRIPASNPLPDAP